jgi:hypothetical protein
MKLRDLSPVLSAVLILLTSSACASAQPPAQETKAGEEMKKKESVPVGPVTREAVEEASAEWVQAEVEAQPDAEAAQALAGVEPGAEVEVFLGTWCGDSRREVPRLWKAIDAAGAAGGSVPFQIHYVGVDHDKKEPAGALADNGIRYLPTFIVRRGGHEVGRIVETSPHGIEHDLLALLTGQAKGVLATREDLTASSAGSSKPPL